MGILLQKNKKSLFFFIALLAAVFVAHAQIALPPALEIPLCPGNAAVLADRDADDIYADQDAAAAELSDGLGAGHSSADAPGDNDQPAVPDHQIRNFQYYTLCYRESYEQAEWSAYCLRAFMLQKNAKRTNDFRPDPQITTGSATLADYKRSGYDRGHLTPAGDMVFSKEAMSESFYMSNMCPQAAAFNRGIWKDLEDQVREWVRTYGAAYIVSGPVLSKPADEYPFIGESKVAVPEYFYKVILVPIFQDDSDQDSPEECADLMAIAFVIPNKGCDGDFWRYAASVDEVEQITGLDFFPLLEDGIEERVESACDPRPWY